MLNSRSIPSELWEQARQALVFYFSRRHGLPNAEDLAHDTLMAIWIRDDFTFETKEQFLRVCYGFASRVSLYGYRQTRKHAAVALDPAMPARAAEAAGLIGVEVKVFLDEVCKAGESGLTDKDWELVHSLMDGGRSELSARFGMGDANNFRVHLHRIREKLARLVGWPRRRGSKKKV